MSASASISVAILDDDESLRRSLKRLMRAAGFEAVAYSSGEEFLADSKRPNFDCLLVDVQFQGMSGIEFSRRLSATGCRTPVIFITAFEDDEVRRQALESGCAGFLRRNEPGQTLLAAIRKASGI